MCRRPSPRIYPEITRQVVAGRPCLLVRANGQQKPYFAYGRAYIRAADEDRQMSARELETLILRRNRDALRWDNEASATPLQGLNESKIRRFLEAAGLPWDNARNALDKLDLLRDGSPSMPRTFSLPMRPPSCVVPCSPPTPAPPSSTATTSMATSSN